MPRRCRPGTGSRPAPTPRPAAHAHQHEVARHRRGRARRRMEPDRHPEGLLPGPGPANYATCTASSAWIELADLNAFLDWMGNAGQPAARRPAPCSARRAARDRGGHDRPDHDDLVRRIGMPSGAYRTSSTRPSPPPTWAPASRAPTTRPTAPTRRCPAPPTPADPDHEPDDAEVPLWDHAGNAEATSRS